MRPRKASAEPESAWIRKLIPKTPHHFDRNIVFRVPDSPVINLSASIVELAEDMLRHSDTGHDLEIAIHFACLAWNLAVLKETQGESYPTLRDSLFKALQIQDKADEMATAELIDTLIEKKIRRYGTIHRWIQHYRLDWIGKECIVNITSDTSPALVDGVHMNDLGT